MEETLEKNSSILILKYKFFLNRILTYFSFLVIPLWLQRSLELNLFFQVIILATYMLFMGGQCYLLGKEVDHRLKIYYRANSSLDRTLYRLLSGGFVMLLIFNIFSVFSGALLSYVFWAFFVALGLFYSWPTRGKIIEESMSHQLSEFKFLDSFERTVLLLISIMFLVSLPELPLFQNVDALKMYYDPQENVSNLFWNFLKISYHPFLAHPKLFNLIWNLHFYFVGLGLFLGCFYGILRYFYSRRLSLLGVFSVVSAWSFTRVLSEDYFASITTSFSVIWVWSLLWSFHSSTYRSGLLVGMVGALGTFLNPLNFLLLPCGLLMGYFFSFKDKTPWFKRQWVKYSLFGLVVSILTLAGKLDTIELEALEFNKATYIVGDYLYRKAFFVIAPLGCLLLFISVFKKPSRYLTYLSLNTEKFREFILALAALFTLGFLVSFNYLDGFTLMWILAFFALIPLEWVFQSISKLRSKRNIIYALYILVCLLDSHFENRLRVVGKLFLDSELYKHLIQL